MNENKKIVRFAKVIKVDSNGNPIDNNINNTVVVEKEKTNPINIILISGILLIIVLLVLFVILYVLPRI